MFHKNPVNIEGGQKYDWGLFGWIFKPRIIDSKGKWTWGKIEINEDETLKTVTIPQEFLDTATYPVYHAAGDIFGNNGTGGSSTICDTSNGSIGWEASTPSGVGGSSATSMSWYLSSTTSANAKYALYSDSGADAPNSLLANGAAAVGVQAFTWTTINFSSSYTLAASTKYWLTILGSTSAAEMNIQYADDVTNSNHAGKVGGGETYATWPPSTFAGFGSTYVNRIYHAYVTYTLATGTNYSRGVYASLPTDDADLTTIYSAGEVSDVATDNDIRVGQTGSGQYIVHQFKNNVGSATTCYVQWQGQTDLSPSVSSVYLQIYNRSTGWQDLTVVGTGSAGIDFTITNVVESLAPYKDGSNIICCRVYQQAT